MYDSQKKQKKTVESSLDSLFQTWSDLRKSYGKAPGVFKFKSGGSASKTVSQ